MKNINLKITGDDLKGLKRIQEVLNEYKKYKVKVGVLGGNYPNGEKIADVAYLHEFGSETPRTFMYKGRKITIRGVPPRSFLRVPMKQLFKQNGLMTELVKLKVIEEFQEGYTGKAFKVIGIESENAIKEAFATSGNGQWERNINEQYIEAKGSNTPLIDSGQLYSSITSKIYKEGL